MERVYPRGLVQDAWPHSTPYVPGGLLAGHSEVAPEFGRPFWGNRGGSAARGVHA